MLSDSVQKDTLPTAEPENINSHQLSAQNCITGQPEVLFEDQH
jgi:hypothetical protein